MTNTNYNVACPFCFSSCKPYLSAPDYNRKASNVIFEMAKCLSCELLFISNPPEDLARYYITDYHYIPASEEALEPLLETEKFKIDLVTRFKKQGSLLEIGPGTGMFCQLSKRAGFDVSAIEMDDKCVNFLRDILNIRVMQSSDPAKTLQDEVHKYDVICLWHSVEHLYAPWETLDAAVKSLAPNGILVIAAPNPNSWQAKILGKRWPHHDLPRHLYALSIPWVAAFAAERQLSIELSTTRDEGSLFWNRFTWAMLAQRLVSGSFWRQRFWNFGMQLGRLLQFWEGREGKGATYTIVLKRL